MKKLTIGLLVALALPVSAAAAADHPDNPKSPSKACKALRAADQAAFKMQYRNLGKCVSEHAKAKTRTTEALHAQENAAKTCKAAKKDDADAFSEQWGSGRNAFGKCVSSTAKSKLHEDSGDDNGDDSGTKSPSKACKTLRAADEAAFKMQYRNLGKCVSEHAKARTRTTEAIEKQENAARTCKAAKKDDADAFSEQWGSGRNGFGKCVSATAKAKPKHHAKGDDKGGDNRSNGHSHHS